MQYASSRSLIGGEPSSWTVIGGGEKTDNLFAVHGVPTVCTGLNGVAGGWLLLGDSVLVWWSARQSCGQLASPGQTQVQGCSNPDLVLVPYKTFVRQ